LNSALCLTHYTRSCEASIVDDLKLSRDIAKIYHISVRARGANFILRTDFVGMS